MLGISDNPTISQMTLISEGTERLRQSFRVETSRIPENDLFNECFETEVKREFFLKNINVVDSQEFEFDEDLCDDCLVLEYQEAFNRNLLKNAFGSEETLDGTKSKGFGEEPKEKSTLDSSKFPYWKIVDSEGYVGWGVESPPLGCESLPEEVRFLGGSSCFVTSGGRCAKEQLISLSQEGLSPSLMDRVRPPLEVSEWCAARYDCGSTYKLKVSLLDKDRIPVRVYSEFRRLEADEDRRWKKVSFHITDYPPGVRFVLFSHFGQDTRFRNGHYGSKMTGGSVIARLPRSFTCRKSRLAVCMMAAAVKE